MTRFLAPSTGPDVRPRLNGSYTEQVQPFAPDVKYREVLIYIAVDAPVYGRYYDTAHSGNTDILAHPFRMNDYINYSFDAARPTHDLRRDWNAVVSSAIIPLGAP